MRITALSGGVGGARLLSGLATTPLIELTAIVNVGDDDTLYGLHLSPDLDTVTYTLAGVHSPDRGWGRDDESWSVMGELARFPIDSTFRLGDKDLALNLYRTARLGEGARLSQVTREITESFGIVTTVLPATDEPLRTKVLVADDWLDFQDYFVRRGHADSVAAIRYDGAEDARPAPGVVEAIAAADAIVIGPSNPFLSVWPILAVPGIEDAIRAKRVLAVSPLVGGAAVKGPLGELLPALGHTTDTSGIVAAYRGLVTDIVVHAGDEPSTDPGPAVHTADTLIGEPAAAGRLTQEIVAWLT